MKTTPQDYDRIYTIKPTKWTSQANDEAAFLALKPSLHHKAPASLLDIGCGNGHTLRYFHDLWPDVMYKGLDGSAVALRLAHQNAPFAELFLADMETASDLPTAEVVVSIGVIEHFQELAHTLQKIATLGSVFYFEVPDNTAYDGRQEGFRQLDGYSRQWEWHLYRPSWEAVLRLAGFRISRKLRREKPLPTFAWILRREE